MAQSHGRIEGKYKPILPAGRRVLVRPHETADYKGNLIIPQSAKEVVPTTGIIMALGFDLEDGNPYRENDAIIYSKYGGVELTFDDGTKVLIIHEDDILGITDSAPQIKEPAQ